MKCFCIFAVLHVFYLYFRTAALTYGRAQKRTLASCRLLITRNTTLHSAKYLSRALEKKLRLNSIFQCILNRTTIQTHNKTQKFEISYVSKRVKLKFGTHRDLFLLKENTSIRNALLSVSFEKFERNSTRKSAPRTVSALSFLISKVSVQSERSED